MKMPRFQVRRKIIIPLIFAVLAGTGIGYLIPHSKVKTQYVPYSSSSSPIVLPAPSNANTFQPISLTGTGQQATKMVKLDQGGYRVTMTNDSSGHFSIWLLDGQGQNLDLLYNDSGSTVNSSKIINVDGGNYSFNVESDGNWTVKIESL